MNIYFENNFITARKEAREIILETLDGEFDGYLCDFHNEVFNGGYDWYMITREEAIEAIEKNGSVWDIIDYIIDYEKHHFGNVNTDFSNPIAVYGMLWYIVGEEELYEMFHNCSEYNKWWNEEIDDEKCQFLIDWYKKTIDK